MQTIPTDLDIRNQDQALAHLFIHCCYKDGNFEKEEVEEAAQKFVELGLQSALNFRDEMLKYRSYRAGINDEKTFLGQLMQLINPVHTKALYSHCVELTLSDSNLDVNEETFLVNLAEVLDISTEEQAVVDKLMIERKAVSVQKLF